MGNMTVMLLRIGKTAITQSERLLWTMATFVYIKITLQITLRRSKFESQNFTNLLRTIWSIFAVFLS